MVKNFAIKEIISIAFHTIEETKPTDEYIRINSEDTWRKFLDWHRQNISATESHSVMVADRIDILRLDNKERIAGISVTPVGNEYYIRKQEYELWMMQ